MKAAGFSAGHVQRAQAIWDDFREKRSLRVIKPEGYAAALEYAIALIHELDGVTQSEIARRYGIARATLSRRYGELRDELSLTARDPRYDVDA